MLRLLMLLGAVLALAGPLRADPAPLPKAVSEAILADPDGFVDFAVDLIHGYGEAGALSVQGVDDHIAIQRAAARASALRRVLAADLDGDGQVTTPEVAVLAGSLAASGRGRLMRVFEQADVGGDGVASAPEITAWAAAEAARRPGPQREAAARAILSFDGNGDGGVTPAELRKAIALLTGGGVTGR